MSSNHCTIHSTYIWKEVHEQPMAIRHALDGSLPAVQKIAQEVERREIDLIVLVARGTSDHAALYAQYVFQYLNGIPVALATPSIVTLYGARLRLRHALVIGISQSGAAPDVTSVVRQAREAGALTVGITNVEGSGLSNAVEHALYCAAGPELSVAATKTYTTTCALLAQLAAYLPGGEALREHVGRLPDLTAAALQSELNVANVAQRYVHARDCVVLGRSFQYSTARETALKLSETCYLVATPFSTADFRHGPTAIIEYGRPVLLYAPPGRTLADNYELLKLLKEKEADTIVISEDARLLELATSPIEVRLPALPGTISGHEASAPIDVIELLAPIPYITYGQFLAMHLSVGKGLNPDKPRGLSKVTRTM
ncbi:MAG TPA: SIS domain-containing protein [Ktedonobacteraceae bacterium]|nr:SIS domain-containing protein [Ktedonobacteraceae bacterium]